MKLLREIAGMLAFNAGALRALAAGGACARSILCAAAGFLSYVLARDSVYADLSSSPGPHAAWGAPGFLLDLNLIQFLLFVLAVYLPMVVAFGNWLAGDGLGFSVSAVEYRERVSTLCALWGVLFFVTAPIQYFAPQFLVLGFVAISIGLLLLLPLLAVYTIWAIGALGCVSLPVACGAFSLSLLTLPVFYAITAYPVWFVAAAATAALASAGRRLRRTGEERLSRSSGDEADLQSRYARAVELRDAGDIEGMRARLHAILDLARSNPALYRRRHREWILRVRSLLSGSAR